MVRVREYLKGDERGGWKARTRRDIPSHENRIFSRTPANLGVKRVPSERGGSPRQFETTDYVAKRIGAPEFKDSASRDEEAILRDWEGVRPIGSHGSRALVRARTLNVILTRNGALGEQDQG